MLQCYLGLGEAGYFKEVAALQSDHLRQVSLYYQITLIPVDPHTHGQTDTDLYICD